MGGEPAGYIIHVPSFVLNRSSDERGTVFDCVLTVKISSRLSFSQ